MGVVEDCQGKVWTPESGHVSWRKTECKGRTYKTRILKVSQTSSRERKLTQATFTRTLWQKEQTRRLQSTFSVKVCNSLTITKADEFCIEGTMGEPEPASKQLQFCIKMGIFTRWQSASWTLNRLQISRFGLGVLWTKVKQTATELFFSSPPTKELRAVWHPQRKSGKSFMSTTLVAPFLSRRNKQTV